MRRRTRGLRRWLLGLCILCSAALTACGFSTVAAAAPAVDASQAGPPSTLTRNADGTFDLANGIVAARVGTTGGRNIESLSLTAAGGHTMATLAKPQALPGPGGIAEELWDPVAMSGIPAGGPLTGKTMLAPTASAVTPDGGAAILVQESREAWLLRRTTVVRRGYAGVQVSWEVENLSAAPSGWSLRARSIVSPGARGPSADLADDVFLPTEKGVLVVDQTLPRGLQNDKYGDIRYFPAAWDTEPPRTWIHGPPKTPRLTEAWAIRLNRQFGDGLAFIADPTECVLWNIDPSTTVEAGFRAQGLRQGQAWKTSMVIVPFTGAAGRTFVRATPLFLETAEVRLDGGVLIGELLPLFEGSLRVESAGEVVAELQVRMNEPVRFDRKPAIPDVGRWQLTAVDAAGVVIGSVDHAKRWALRPVEAAARVVRKPEVKGDVYEPEDAAGKIAAFLDRRDFSIHVTANASDAERELASRMARRLGVGLVLKEPVGKLLVVGTPENNTFLRNSGMLTESVDDRWPGGGRGAILHYDSIELTGKPLVLVCGSDQAGTLKAADEFFRRHVEPRTPPEDFDVWATSVDTLVYPWSRRGMHAEVPTIRLDAARGEYEAAQAVVTAFGDVRKLTVTVDPLIHAETGAVLEGKTLKHRTAFRTRHAPLWIRYVDYAPFPPADGWSGNPDPLLERGPDELPAGRSQGIWLTAIIPDNAPPGLYRSRLVCTGDGVERVIPIEVNVWDFVLPLTGVPGHPYVDFQFFPTDSRRVLESQHVRQLVSNLVEHGMRWINVGQALDLIRTHPSAAGEYKDVKIPWLEVNDDGTLAMDFSRWDWFAKEADAAAKPYELSYMAYSGVLGTAVRDFAAAVPGRHQPPAAGESHPLHGYEVEVLTLFKRHLEKQGMLHRFVYKVGDEPASLRGWYEKSCRPANEVRMPFMTAMNAFNVTEAETLLGTSLAVWQPLYGVFRPEFIAKARAAGQKVSWYNCGPPPHSCLKTPAAEIRGYIWQASKYELDSVCWWGVQNWRGGHANAWSNYYEHHNQLVYPAHPAKPPWHEPGKSWRDQAPLDSIRWEHLRDGMEDSAYVTALRDAIAACRQSGRTADADRGQAVLDGIWSSLFPDMTAFRPSLGALIDARKTIATTVVELTPANAKSARTR